LVIPGSVQAVMRAANKKFGHGTVITGADVIGLARPTISTGSLSFDVALGGGWAVNHFIELVGHRSAGKTAVVLKTIAEQQSLNKEWLTVWVASEDFHEPFAEMFGVDLARVILINDPVMESALEMVIDLLKTREIDCVVVDSIPALVPEREDDDGMADQQVGLQARILGKFFRKANPYVKRALDDSNQRPLTVFMVNQWRNKIGGYGDPRVSPGGEAKDYYCFQQVEIQRVEWIKNTKSEPIGQTMRLVNRKNKWAPPGRRGEMDIYFASTKGHKAGDYDVLKDIASAAKTYGIVKVGGGGYHTFGDERWHGEAALVEAMKEEPKLRRQIHQAVMKETTSAATAASQSAPGEGRSGPSKSPAAQGLGQRAAPTGPARRRTSVRVQNGAQGEQTDHSQAGLAETAPVQRSSRKSGASRPN
jgi:recombination protein RecA